MSRIDPSLFVEETISGQPVLKVENVHASAVVSLYGGQLLSYQPHGEKDLLWLSPTAVFKQGTAIRGGIPVCWPWFGKRKEGGSNHGYARISNWELITAEALEDGDTRLCLTRIPAESTDEKGAVKASLQLEIVVGKALKICLHTINNGAEVIRLSQALHSYFAVSNVEHITISGLDNTCYDDSASGQSECIQQGDVVLSGEVDRIYLNTSTTCAIHDPGLNRTIMIEKEGSNSTVVWNPGADLAATMADIPESDFISMVCVETATAPQLPVELGSGQSHQLTARIFLEKG